ncbi:hypothetical protein B0H19DRAFT_966216, partial [Mycena capillaripes]
YVGISPVDNYCLCPTVYRDMTLYEWVQCADKKARTRDEGAEFLAHLHFVREMQDMLCEDCLTADVKDLDVHTTNGTDSDDNFII